MPNVIQGLSDWRCRVSSPSQKFTECFLHESFEPRQHKYTKEMDQCEPGIWHTLRTTIPNIRKNTEVCTKGFRLYSIQKKSPQDSSHLFTILGKLQILVSVFLFFIFLHHISHSRSQFFILSYKIQMDFHRVGHELVL